MDDESVLTDVRWSPDDELVISTKHAQLTLTPFDVEMLVAELVSAKRCVSRRDHDKALAGFEKRISDAINQLDDVTLRMKVSEWRAHDAELELVRFKAEYITEAPVKLAVDEGDVW